MVKRMRLKPCLRYPLARVAIPDEGNRAMARTSKARAIMISSVTLPMMIANARMANTTKTTIEVRKKMTAVAVAALLASPWKFNRKCWNCGAPAGSDVPPGPEPGGPGATGWAAD
jgi:hypothetical protein